MALKDEVKNELNKQVSVTPPGAAGGAQIGVRPPGAQDNTPPGTVATPPSSQTASEAAESAITPPTKPLSGEVGNKKDEMISVPRGILEQLMNDVQNLKSGRTQPKVERVTQHTATIRLWEGKYPIMRIVKTWITNKNKPEEETHCQFEYDIDGKLHLKAIPYLDFLDDVPKAKVIIMSQEVKENREYLGKKRKANPDPVKFGDDGKYFEPGMIDDEVVSVDYISKVKILNGKLKNKEVTISNNWLNM